MANPGGIMAARVLQIEAALQGMSNRMDNMTGTLLQLGEDTLSSATSITALRNDLAGATKEALDQVNAQFGVRQAALLQVVNDARHEFDTMKASISSLYGGTGSGLADVLSKVRQLAVEVENLKASGPVGGGGASTGMKGFLPLKQQLPNTFGKNEADWRSWQEDVLLYIDTMSAGMSEFMKASEHQPREITSAWINSLVGPSGTTKSMDLHRCLRGLTEGEARTVVQGVRDEMDSRRGGSST